MESSKYVNPAESASQDLLPAFLQEFDEDFTRDMAAYAESLDTTDYIFEPNYMFDPLISGELPGIKNQIVLSVEELYFPQDSSEPILSPTLAAPTLDTPPATPVVDMAMEADDLIEEDIQDIVVSAPTPRKKPVPIHRSKTYRADIDVDADDVNKYDRLLAKMPKSNAGRKRKFVTTNMSRNALAARENRDKKKEYMEDLEEGMRELNDKYKKVLKVLDESERENTSLREAIKYYLDLIGKMKSSALQREG